MATLQSGKCFTVPTFIGMCCRSEWQERMYIYKWHEVDQTKHEIFCVHIVCNEIQVKVNLEINTFFFYLRFPYCPNFFWFGVVHCSAYAHKRGPMSLSRYEYYKGTFLVWLVSVVMNVPNPVQIKSNLHIEQTDRITSLMAQTSRYECWHVLMYRFMTASPNNSWFMEGRRAFIQNRKAVLHVQCRLLKHHALVIIEMQRC